MNSPDAPSPRLGRVAVNGLSLAYLEWPGRPGAPAVVCVPHLTGHKGSFAWLAARLAPEFHVYAFDLRGRGHSDHPDEGYGFAYHAADLLGAARALGLEQFALVGHSFGATASVYLASVRPALVRALVLLDGGADPKEDTLRAMYPTIRRLDKVYASADDYVAAMRAIPFFNPWNAALEQYFRDEAQALPEGGVRARASAAGIQRDLDQHFLYSLCLHFPALRCPVLFVRPGNGLLGERGHVFSEAEAAAITRHIPNCRRVDVPGVNHYTVLINPESPAFEEVLAFLREVM